ncbi:MAG: GntR family transcriptional regulator [Opitutales bacterium]|jgi:GntR family transcriptional regulator
MLPFSIELKPGLPVAEQVLFAVKRAVVSGQLQPGDKFPSVRQLSQELRINPNTAHKVQAALVHEGVLVTTPAIGSIVARPVPGSRRERAELLGPELERTIVEAKKFGLTLDEVQTAVAAHWRKLSDPSKP